jgi:hypothetical protein
MMNTQVKFRLKFRRAPHVYVHILSIVNVVSIFTFADVDFRTV